MLYSGRLKIEPSFRERETKRQKSNPYRIFHLSHAQTQGKPLERERARRKGNEGQRKWEGMLFECNCCEVFELRFWGLSFEGSNLGARFQICWGLGQHTWHLLWTLDLNELLLFFLIPISILRQLATLWLHVLDHLDSQTFSTRNANKFLDSC